MVDTRSLFIYCKIATEFDARGNDVTLVPQVLINQVVCIKVDVLFFAYYLYFSKRYRLAIYMRNF
jgi:hypothetical protein